MVTLTFVDHAQATVVDGEEIVVRTLVLRVGRAIVALDGPLGDRPVAVSMHVNSAGDG